VFHTNLASWLTSRVTTLLAFDLGTQAYPIVAPQQCLTRADSTGTLPDEIAVGIALCAIINVSHLDGTPGQ
jgi:hypothetical protein